MREQVLTKYLLFINNTHNVSRHLSTCNFTGFRQKGKKSEKIFHSQGLRRSAANLVGSHRRIRLREILLACLSALRFDMEEV